MFIHLFSGWVLLFGISTNVWASHFLEPIGTEIPRIAPEGRFFIQSGVRLVKSDASATVQNDDIFVPVVLEYGLGHKSQFAFEADMLVQDEAAGRNVPANKGPSEIAFAFRHLLRGDAEDAGEEHMGGHSESKYECNCLSGEPLAFELEFAPSTSKTRGAEVKLMFLRAQNVLKTHHLFLNAGVAFEGEVEDNAHVYTPHVLYNAAYMVPLNRELLHGAVELNGKVKPGSAGDRAEWILRPQVIWYSPQNSMAVKFGIAFGISHDDPERGGSLLVSRLF